MPSRRVPGRPPTGWYPKRGEVYLVALDKPRPAIVLSVNPLNQHAMDVCLVPVTSVQHQEFRVRVPIRAGDGGLHADYWAKCDQVATLEKSFLRYPPLGTLSDSTLANIQMQVKFALGLL